MLDKLFPLYAFMFFISLLFTASLEKRLIPYLKAKAGQPIYMDGPSWHRPKDGTPTMGGIAFIAAITASLIIAFLLIRQTVEKAEALKLLLLVLYAVSNALVGFIDDRKKLLKKQNDGGLKPREKLILQLLLATAFLVLRISVLGGTTAIVFSFGTLELGFFYYPITVFILLGMINSVNLTDGIDGLASSVTFAVGISFFYISYTVESSMTLCSAALIGATVGFLIFNLHPAKIFMGDTGSLFFGALVSGMAVLLDNPIMIILIGAVYSIEGFSVVMQVLCFKLFKRRIFKMAPLHHHFEKCGYSENTICIAAIIISFIFSVFA